MPQQAKPCGSCEAAAWCSYAMGAFCRYMGRSGCCLLCLYAHHSTKCFHSVVRNIEGVPVHLRLSQSSTARPGQCLEI